MQLILLPGKIKDRIQAMLTLRHHHPLVVVWQIGLGFYTVLDLILYSVCCNSMQDNVTVATLNLESVK